MGHPSQPCSLRRTSQLDSREASQGADCRLPKISKLPHVLTDWQEFWMQASPAADWPSEIAWRSARTAKRAGHLLAASQATSVP